MSENLAQDRLTDVDTDRSKKYFVSNIIFSYAMISDDLINIRLASECEQKANELEDLYKKLLEKQQLTLTIGVPDRPVNISKWKNMLITCIFVVYLLIFTLASKAKDDLTALLVQCTQHDVASNFLLARTKLLDYNSKTYDVYNIYDISFFYSQDREDQKGKTGSQYWSSQG